MSAQRRLTIATRQIVRLGNPERVAPYLPHHDAECRVRRLERRERAPPGRVELGCCSWLNEKDRTICFAAATGLHPSIANPLYKQSPHIVNPTCCFSDCRPYPRVLQMMNRGDAADLVTLSS